MQTLPGKYFPIRGNFVTLFPFLIVRDLLIY